VKSNNAFPEGVMPGNWKVNSGSGRVNMPDLTLEVPFGNKPKAVCVRNHEYCHIKFSPRQMGNIQSELESFSIRAFEDCRVNMLGTDSGVELSSAVDMNSVIPIMDDSNTHIRTGLTISAVGYDVYDTILESFLTPFELDIVTKYVEAISKVKYDFDAVKQLAIEYTKLFEPPKQVPDDVGEQMRESDSDLSDSDSDLSDELKNDEDDDKPPCIIKFNHKRGSDALEDSGQMSIHKHKLTNRNVWKGTRRSDTGYVLRHPERIITDSMCFETAKRMPFVGTILIDVSGSMELNYNDVEKLVKAGCGCTVATYSGNSHTNKGKLHILSQNGNMVSKMPNNIRLGCNIIDVPVLLWLSKQRGHKLWVCDGHVTGKGNYKYQSITAECARLVDKYKIVNMREVDDALKHIDKVKRKSKR